MEARGLWDVESRALPIAVKESLALLRALESLAGRVRKARIDAFVDNKVLLASWESQLSRYPQPRCLATSQICFWSAFSGLDGDS